MSSRLLQLRIWLEHHAVYPRSRLAILTSYLLALDVLLFILQQLSNTLHKSFGASLGGWVIFLSLVVVTLLVVLSARRVSGGLLWRLRNRLIVTYVFIGVIPLVLLTTLFVGAFYLFAGQFASYLVTSQLKSAIDGLRTRTELLARETASSLDATQSARNLPVQGASEPDIHVSVWLNRELVRNSPSASPAIPLPKSLSTGFAGLVREQNRVFLRSISQASSSHGNITVIASTPLDARLLATIAPDLGEVATGEVDPDTQGLIPKYSAGSIPARLRLIDGQVSFGTRLPTVNWSDGTNGSEVGLGGATRLSKIYGHLFSALGVIGAAMEVFLLVIALAWGIFEAVAWYIGTQLTRTVTGSVAQLYLATRFVNRGDFSHRIPITSKDQLAALASSFNLMTESIERLVEEQKQKQRLENEITIAQEVQNQLFPRRASKLSNLEVHGFCRPARSVSGDYYDFVPVGAEQLLLAVGDVSGKGISAALLMATIHSAVRAYSLEGMPVLRQAEAVVASGVVSARFESVTPGVEVSPGTMLSLLNHQLYHSTPMEKYATLFLGMYDTNARRLTYANAGHLPPLLLPEDGTCRRLERGGTVVGLFDEVSYDEGTVELRPGDLFLAYSDGVTEPENDFGEFGERRLIELVQENRDLPLPRISELVTSAVDDWIGAAEQPDDVTLVLARVR